MPFTLVPENAGQTPQEADPLLLTPGHGLLSLKLLVKGQEGSKKEIQVKAALHKLRWLYRNRVLLEAAFQDTWQFMGRLAELREAAPVHRLNQTQQP